MNSSDETEPGQLAVRDSAKLRAQYEADVVTHEVELAKRWISDPREGETGIHISHTYANSDGYYERTDLDVEIR